MKKKKEEEERKGVESNYNPSSPPRRTNGNQEDGRGGGWRTRRLVVSWCFKPSQPQKDYIRAEGDFHKEICSIKD